MSDSLRLGATLDVDSGAVEGDNAAAGMANKEDGSELKVASYSTSCGGLDGDRRAMKT